MGSFDGVAEIYQESRHTYPSKLRDHLVAIGVLMPDSVAVDLGAGTGQLAILVDDVAAEIIAVEPEADMVQVGQKVTSSRPSIKWLLGADCDVLDLLDPPVDLVLIGNAFHHMDQVRLLTDLDVLVASNGAVAVCSSSIPVWLQDTAWSMALRAQLAVELGRPVGTGGTPDHASDSKVLSESVFCVVQEWVHEHEQARGPQSVVGEILSSSAGMLSGGAHQRLHSVLTPHLREGVVVEQVRTTALVAQRMRS